MEHFPTSFHIFANKVIIWQPQAILAVLIQDEYIVAMFRGIYHALWEQNKSRQEKDER